MTANDLRKHKPMFRPPVRPQRPADLAALNHQNDSSAHTTTDESSELESVTSGTDLTSAKKSTSPGESDINKEFLLSYVRFIYGLSSENPNLNFRLQPKKQPGGASKETSPSHSHVLTSTSSDSGFLSITNAAEKTGSSLAVSFSNSGMGVSFNNNNNNKSRSSTVSSTVTTPTKSSSGNLTDLAANDPFADDVDTISMILNLETDDSSSLVNVEIANKPGDGAAAAGSSASHLSSQSVSSDINAVGVVTPTVMTTPSDSQSLCKSESGKKKNLIESL